MAQWILKLGIFGLGPPELLVVGFVLIMIIVFFFGGRRDSED